MSCCLRSLTNKYSSFSMFSTGFLIFLAFIGSSLAEVTDVNRIESLQQLHSIVKDYVENLSIIYHGFRELLRSKEYTDFTALKENKILSGAVSKLTQNQTAPNDSEPEQEAIYTAPAPNDSEPEEEVVTVAQIITTWKDLAVTVIEYCTKTADTFVRNGASLETDYSTDVQRQIVEKTVQVMKNINGDPKIIDELKRDGCPIYEHLETVIGSYGGIQAALNFRLNYGSDKNEENDGIGDSNKDHKSSLE